MVIDFSNLGGGGGGGEYVLPTATKTRLGGIKVGDGLEYKNDGTINVTGTTETDNITTEIVAEKLQANAIIDVDTLPSTGIKANSVYRLNVQKLYDVDGEEMTPLLIYSATSESITFSENGMDFDGTLTPFSSFTDSFVNGYAENNYFVLDIKATSSEKNFVQLGENSYAYIDQIENKKVLYFRDGNEWKEVGGDIELDELTTEMADNKLQANAIIDVTNLPSTGIKANTVYRRTTQVITPTPLVIYTATSDGITIGIGDIYIQGEPSSPFSFYNVDDSLVAEFISKGYFTVTEIAESVYKSFIKLNQDSYSPIDKIKTTRELYFRDGNNWKKVGEINLDDLTTEMDEGKLQANAIIDVENLPTLNIKANSIYRKDVQKLYDVENEEITPLAIYSASSELITFTENGMDFDGVVTPFSSITDSLVEDYLAQGYLTTTDKATSSEKNFVKVDTDSYAYIDRIENSKVLFYRDGNEWKQVGSGESKEVELDEITTEMVNEKLQANAIIDVENLPSTDIKANSVYRKDVQRFFDENDEELTPLAIYVDSSSTISVTEQGIQLEGEAVTPWSSIDDETVEGYLTNEYFTVEDKAVSNSNSFIKTGTDSYSYIYRLVTEKELFYRNGNVWKMIGGGGGGGTTIELDEVTTEMADNKLQANALVRVNALPSTDIKANSLYAVTENVSYTNSGETKSFSMHKTFKRDGNNWVSISTISLTGEEYEHLSEAQKMDGTVYIVDDLTPVITDEFSYDILANKPEINGITLQGTLSLEDINVYSRTDVNNLLTNKGEVEFVNQLPVTPDENTWYYSKKFEDGTDVPDDKRALYIVLDDVTVYNYMGVVGDVEMETGDTLSGSEHLVTSSQVVKKEMSTKVNKYATQVNIETAVNDATLWTNLAQIGTDDKKTDSSMVFNAGTCYLIGSVSPTNTAQIYQFIVTGSVGASAINKKITLINPLTNEIFTKSMDSGTWQAWKGGKKYKHTLVRYNTDSFQYTMGWTSVITDKKTMSVDDFKTWLNEKGYTTVTNSYYWCGGCCGTTEVRNSADTGKAFVGKVVSGVFYNGTDLFFKWDYNGTTQINPARCKVYTEELN